MPTHWIQRTIEASLRDQSSPLRLFSVWLLTGPRQVGKSSLLRRLGDHSGRLYINLDDLDTRTRANRDPVLFLKELRYPVTIDEIQYAPELLSGLKIRADSSKIPGDVWLSGSQNFEVMRGVQESLAGRVAILNLFGLSDEEKEVRTFSPPSQFATLLETSFPKLFGVTDEPTRSLYLSSYVQTYLERDVRELLGVQKRREFEVFLKLCAIRTGQILNLDELARDAGISSATAKEWISVLEDSFILQLVHPFHSNRSKRLIKSPKMYFLDAGLAAYLSGWRDPEQLRLSPMAGAFFETQVFGNLIRAFSSRIQDFQVHFWRTREGQEIDFILETKGKCYPLEVKMGMPDTRHLVALEKIREPNWESGTVLSLVGQSPKSVTPPSLTNEWRLASPDFIEFLATNGGVT